MSLTTDHLPGPIQGMTDRVKSNSRSGLYNLDWFKYSSQMEQSTETGQVKIVSGREQLKAVSMIGAEGCQMLELLTEREGTPNFAMRLFEVAPGGHTPQHQHPWEHEIYVLAGKGELRGENTHLFEKGDAMLVPTNTRHQFYNSGTEPLRFLCLIPHQANYQP